MKSVKWMLAALLAVAVCTPLMAQNNKDLGAKIQRQIQLQSQKNKTQKCRLCGNEITNESQRCAADCDVICMPENDAQAKPQAKKQEAAPAKAQVKETKSLGKCWRCGNEITNEFQRCAADCDVTCMPENEPTAKPQAKKQEAAPAKTQEKETKSLGKCRWCGNEITDEWKRCPNDPDVTCMPAPKAEKAGKKVKKAKPAKKTVKQDYETCPECHAVYDDDYYFHGVHHCGFNH
ncbi:hypothetical protein [Candidatus Avelusimicrobium stercoris]|uniref:hypothetical protein n=1 Tax=Candidatus Avelusimicrobium stercoris TaxID=1947924 RepID=UPI003D0EC007